jgi:putative membrane protein
MGQDDKVNTAKTPHQQTEKVDERPGLARLRTEMALDRTMLAWVRTTLSLVGFGFGMVAFFRSLRVAHPGEYTVRLHVAAIVFGITLLVLGVISMLFAGLFHRADRASLQRGETPALRQWSLSLALMVSLMILSIVGLVTMLVL